jgi:hypothetical protein
MGEAPTIAIERGSKKALSSSLDEVMFPANESAVFELRRLPP